MHKGAAALLWGEPAASMLASAFGWRAACFRRGGNHPRPGLPLGETGKGDQIPCCRRLICPGKTSAAAGSRPSLRFGLFFAIGVPRCVALHPKLVHPSALARRRFEAPVRMVCGLRWLHLRLVGTALQGNKLGLI